MKHRGGIVGLGWIALSLGACSAEVRTLGPSQPQTPPAGAADPRIKAYEGSYYQISQGGLYFSWYGCAACHGADAKGVLDLADDRWKFGGDFNQVYDAIAARHPGPSGRYGARVPSEQLWELTAYVRQLKTLQPEYRQREDLDQSGQPQAASWSGPVP